jgi:hypothetical protein
LRWLLVASLSVALAGCSSGGSGPGRQGDDRSGARTVVGNFVSHASWTHPAPGWRLHVTPTVSGRNRAAGSPSVALAQAVKSAGALPFAMTAAIRDSLLSQLHCHAVFARHKPRWNLEAWRPDVGYVRTVAALCNP